MEDFKNYIENNRLEDCINYLENLEGNEYEIKFLIDNVLENNKIYFIYLLFYVSFKKNTPFWYNITGYALSFYLSHIEGAERTALLMFKKSFELDSTDNSVLNAILDFRNPPEVVLTNNEFEYYNDISKTRQPDR